SGLKVGLSFGSALASIVLGLHQNIGFELGRFQIRLAHRQLVGFAPLVLVDFGNRITSPLQTLTEAGASTLGRNGRLNTSVRESLGANLRPVERWNLWHWLYYPV